MMYTIRDLTITNSIQLVEGIRVVTPVHPAGLTVERVAFTNLGAGTGVNAYGIQHSEFIYRFNS